MSSAQSLSNDTRRLIRQIIRQVHPDLFAANPYERQCNSDSLQVRLGFEPAPQARLTAAGLFLYANKAVWIRGIGLTVDWLDAGAERLRR